MGIGGGTLVKACESSITEWEGDGRETPDIVDQLVAVNTVQVSGKPFDEALNAIVEAQQVIRHDWSFSRDTAKQNFMNRQVPHRHGWRRSSY